MDCSPERECVYLCGNSQGLQPKTARSKVLEAMDSWAHRYVVVYARGHIFPTYRGVTGHMVGSNPWYRIEDTLISGTAKLVGAKDVEVIVMNSLTVNIHLGLVSR